MKKYWPLFVVVIFSFLGSLAVSCQMEKLQMMYIMIHFMGFFFFFLSSFKFWDLLGFAEGFAMYDILAKKKHIYGYVYPFLELLIALMFLANIWIPVVAIFTVVLMGFSAIGVIQSVLAGLDLRCACMGTKLDLPLSTVSIVENLGMGIMSFVIVLWSFGLWR